MKNKFFYIFIMGFFYLSFIKAQGTIHFTGATDNGATVQSETISGTVYATVSTTDVLAATGADLYDYGTESGRGSGNAAFITEDYVSNGATQATILFSKPVNISSMFIFDWYDQANNWTLTPSPLGSNSTYSANSVRYSGSTISPSFNNITSISITIGGGGKSGIGIDDIVVDAVLPVELSSFTAQQEGNMITLNWSTATEVRNYGFEVEKSKVKSQNSNVDVSWEKIGFVEGNGNSNSPKEYSFVDKTVSTGKYFYRLKQIDFDGQYEYSQVVDVQVDAPLTFALKQNYPNPFNPKTIIGYQLPNANHVTLKVYDILGNEVAVLVNGLQTAGDYEIPFNGEKLTSGIYFYKLQTSDGFTAIKKLMLVK